MALNFNKDIKSFDRNLKGKKWFIDNNNTTKKKEKKR